jgi:tetratricopeptide (TPR) repeat protein/DNA-binding CsgD family transcriptional regulator
MSVIAFNDLSIRLDTILIYSSTFFLPEYLNDYFRPVKMIITRLSIIIIAFSLHCSTYAQETNNRTQKLPAHIRKALASHEADFMEVKEYLSAPGSDPVALAKHWRAQLQPIKPNSVLSFNLAYVDVLAHVIKYDGNQEKLKLFKPYLDTMLRIGLSATDIRQQAKATWDYGSLMLRYQGIEEAATHLLLSVQLYEKLPFIEVMYERYGTLAAMLFHTGDYGPSVAYGRKALADADWIAKNNEIAIAFQNTLGQAYFRLGNFDSAAYYYRQSKQNAAERGSNQWVAINESFEAQLYLEKGEPGKAYPLFEKGFNGNRDIDFPMESFSAAGMGKTLLAMEQTAAAKPLLWHALQVAGKTNAGQRWQVTHYRKDALTTLARLYQKQNRQDSFYYYFLEANRLEDSMVKVVSLSNLRMAETRSEVEQSRMQVAIMAEKENRNRMVRNFIIAGIVLAASFIILLLSRRNRILQLEKQMADVKQQAADAEMASAREQLDLFTRSLHEKTHLLDQLQQQATTESNGLQMDIIQDLTRQAILTEEDWQFFRNSFDKIYPGFFMRLRQAAPDITMAEQRMAALTLLKMNGKEIAAVLGISPESVRKTRQRLRQRVQIDAQDDLGASLQRLA